MKDKNQIKKKLKKNKIVEVGLFINLLKGLFSFHDSWSSFRKGRAH